MIQNDQSEILNHCLTLIEHKRVTLDQCVARYPQYKELGEQLEAALTVRALPLPRLDSARRQSIRNQMMAQYRATPAAHTRPQVAAKRSTPRISWALRAFVSGFMVLV